MAADRLHAATIRGAQAEQTKAFSGGGLPWVRRHAKKAPGFLFDELTLDASEFHGRAQFAKRWQRHCWDRRAGGFARIAKGDPA